MPKAIIGLKGGEINKLNDYPCPLPNIRIYLPLFESSMIKFFTEPFDTLPLKFNINALSN